MSTLFQALVPLCHADLHINFLVVTTRLGDGKDHVFFLTDKDTGPQKHYITCSSPSKSCTFPQLSRVGVSWTQGTKPLDLTVSPAEGRRIWSSLP